jgi:predicted dehydrogenase
MADQVRWGILATGGIAHTFAGDLVADGHAIAAVGSRSQASAEAFAAQFGIPKAYGSYEALVADPDVDIVYIATPHPFHAHDAVMALNAGKHVLVEKPITLNAREAEELAELAAERGLLLLEAMWTRFLPHVRRIREIIAAGALGRLRSFTADHRQKLSSDPAHRINAPVLGGGALLDLGIYPISFAAHLFGTPQEVQATAVFGPTGVDAEVATLFRYADGQIATTLSASDTRGPNTASIVGTDARIDIDSVWYAPTTFRVVRYDGSLLETWENTTPGRGMQYQAREAEELLAAGKTASDILSPTESVNIMATMDEVRRQIGLTYPSEAAVNGSAR